MQDNDTTEQQVTVLGKTFSSDEERRAYFREELRKKLPELKQMEGFPIGEDDDILNLSDPPYYTTCPNPWINDFINQWENEKITLENQNKRESGKSVIEPFAKDVSEGKNNPVYAAHSYHTKVPHPAIMRYILYFTQAGDIVFDGFAGTGMTGVAGQLCGSPDAKLKERIESEFRQYGYEKPRWGKRHVICSDLSPIASFLAFNYNTKIDLIQFSDQLEEVFKKVEKKCSWMYDTMHSDHQSKGKISYMVWSDVYSCGNCNEELVYWDYSINTETAQIQDIVTCKKCGSSNKIKSLDRVYETEFDFVTDSTRKKAKQVPVLKYYQVGSKKYVDTVNQFDIDLIEKIRSTVIQNSIAENLLTDGYNTRQPIRSHGFEYVHDFYTKRNAITLNSFHEEIYRTGNLNLLFILTGMVVRSTMMNRIHLKNFVFGGGGWNAGHRKGTLYMPSISIETSPLVQTKDKLKSAIKAFSITKNNRSIISVNSATQLPIENNSIDFMYLDPPFGANIVVPPKNWTVN